MQNSVSTQLFDPLQYFSWWVFAGVVAAYSALVFHGELSKDDGPLIFSKRNSRSISNIVSIHLVFLTMLFVLMRCCIIVYPFLPDWMTDSFYYQDPIGSVFDILYMLTMIALHYVERRYLYVELATASDKSDAPKDGP